jgi:hypothetical protein
MKETINIAHNNFCLELIYDLISHCNKLGTECNERKAAYLCEVFIKF